MGHNARWFDASYKVFQHNFKSLFASEFTICWLLKSCKVLENGAYLERECVSFWIREAFESNCKRNWQEASLDSSKEGRHYKYDLSVFYLMPTISKLSCFIPHSKLHIPYIPHSTFLIIYHKIPTLRYCNLNNILITLHAENRYLTKLLKLNKIRKHEERHCIRHAVVRPSACNNGICIIQNRCERIYDKLHRDRERNGRKHHDGQL